MAMVPIWGSTFTKGATTAPNDVGKITYELGSRRVKAGVLQKWYQLYFVQASESLCTTMQSTPTHGPAGRPLLPTSLSKL